VAISSSDCLDVEALSDLFIFLLFANLFVVFVCLIILFEIYHYYLIFIAITIMRDKPYLLIHRWFLTSFLVAPVGLDSSLSMRKKPWMKLLQQ